MCIYKNHNSDEQYWNKMQHLEPCPRFAYQLVYDPKNKVFIKGPQYQRKISLKAK